MKAALFLLCALGTSTSNFLVRTGEENVYNYQGKILTGIPELEQTFAGMAIECEVLLQGQGFTAEGPGNGVFKIALRNIKFNNFNDRFTQRRRSREFYAQENYRSETNQVEAVPSEYQKPHAIKTMDCRVKQTNVPQALSGHHPPRGFRNDSLSALNIQEEYSHTLPFA